MSDDAILQKYPELVRKDLAAVREHIAAFIKSRTHDDITGRPILLRDRLVHGRYYKGHCRHATVARWNADENRFYHWREKFDYILYRENMLSHGRSRAVVDTFDVVEELSETKFEIPFDMEATFTGILDDLTEHDAEMWRN